MSEQGHEPEKKEKKKRRTKKEIEAENEALRKENDEIKELAMRIQADFDNYRKRINRENEEKEKYGCEKLMVRVLDVVDTLERAISHEKGEFKTGLEMIKAQLEAVLSEFGVQPIDAAGKPFDPYFHEAVAMGEGDDGVVIEEFQKGYVLHDRVIRHSKVKVGKK
jgi:molecular chaperone GrpE